MLKENEKLAIQEFKKKVKEFLGSNLIEMKLFGSKLKGDDTWDSDIDIAVIVKTLDSKIEDKIVDISFPINMDYSTVVSPVVIAKTNLEDPIWRIAPFIKTIVNEAQII